MRQAYCIVAGLLLAFFVRSAASTVVPADVTGFTATTVDAIGNTFACGYFSGSALAVGGKTLTRIGTQDAFVVKTDANGNVIWAKNFGGLDAVANCVAIAVDNGGTVYLGGGFVSGNLTTPPLAQIGAIDAFVIKLDSNGNTVWAHNFGGSKAFTGSSSIAVDDSGNVYLGGTFSYSNLTVPALTKIGYEDAFVIKLDSAGNTTWAKNFGGSGPPWPVVVGGTVAVDGSDSVYVSGYFSGADLTSPSLTRLGVYDTFVVKLDSRGTIAWAKNFGGSGTWMQGQAVAVDSVSHDVYLSGYFSNSDLSYPTLDKLGTQDAFALSLDSNGAIVWSKGFGGAGAKTWGLAVAADSSGGAILGGWFENASLTTPALTKIGASDAFAIKLDPAGGIVWANNYGGGSAQGNAVALDRAGNTHLSGEFSGASMTVPALPLIGAVYATDAFTITLNSVGVITSALNYGTPFVSAIFQGLWWNPSESGWGINFAHSGDQIFATWYTYDVTGKAWWLSMLASRTTPTNNVYAGTIYVDSGPPFNGFVGAGVPTAVGSGTLTFSDANYASFAYTVNTTMPPTTQTKPITRFDLGTGPQPTCAYSNTTPNFAAATNYQDLWWVPNGAESGWGVNFAHQGDSIFATWYTYNILGGTPLWLSALAQRQGTSNSYTGPIIQNSGPHFDAYDTSKVVTNPVGTATFTFADGNDATFGYTVMVAPLPGPVTQFKQLTRFRFAATGGTVCQ